MEYNFDQIISSTDNLDETIEPNENPPNIRKRKRINTYKKISFEKRFAQVLLDSLNNPFNIGMNGAYFIDNENFAVNPKILSFKLSIKANSLLKDFRCLDIIYVKKLPKQKNIYLPEPKNWKIYRHLRNEFTLNKLIENLSAENKTKILNWDESKQYPKKKVQTSDIQNQINSNMDESEVTKTKEKTQVQKNIIDIKLYGEPTTKNDNENEEKIFPEDLSCYFF